MSGALFYCFFGRMATEQFSQMADCLFQSDWPNLPIQLQKYYILMIDNAQLPLCYHGFGMTIMNLETFTKVSNAMKWLQNDVIKCL